jgi:hypothetical protein
MRAAPTTSSAVATLRTCSGTGQPKRTTRPSNSGASFTASQGPTALGLTAWNRRRAYRAARSRRTTCRTPACIRRRHTSGGRTRHPTTSQAPPRRFCSSATAAATWQTTVRAARPTYWTTSPTAARSHPPSLSSSALASCSVQTGSPTRTQRVSTSAATSTTPSPRSSLSSFSPMSFQHSRQRPV